MSVRPTITHVMSTLFVITQVDPIDVLAGQDTLEMDKCARVKIISFVCFAMRLFCLFVCFFLFLQCNATRDTHIFSLLIVTNHWFFSLKDVNECANNTHNCDVNAYCNDTEGSFFCSCNRGYSGNGTYCTGKCFKQLFQLIF